MPDDDSTRPSNKIRCNAVHTILRRWTLPGLEIKCNWRYWGLSLSWGDNVSFSISQNELVPVWFVGLNIGPMFFIYYWSKS